MHNWLLLNLLAVNPYFRLSLISSMETFGQESLFSLRPENQRDLWPDRHLTADQTGWVPLEWHLEPLQGMRAPTDLQSTESVRVKGEGENEVLQTQLVWKRLNQAQPQCCGELTPEQLEVFLLSSHSSSDITHWQQFALKLKSPYILVHLQRQLPTRFDMIFLSFTLTFLQKWEFKETGKETALHIHHTVERKGDF